MLKIFLDTEFTTLGPGRSRLISIGIVDERAEKSFYAELTDNYLESDCSYFVVETVLPLLDAPVLPVSLDYRNIYAKMTKGQCQQHLAAWIASFHEPVQMVTDSPGHDFAFVERLFGGHPWPIMLDRQTFRFLYTDEGWIHFENLSNSHWDSKQYRRHHALDDAKVLRLVFQEMSHNNKNSKNLLDKDIDS